jgi:hypothetical protein
VDVATWLAVGVVVALLAAWYLSYSAARLDRLHHRVESSRAALDAQLTRRAALAVEVAPLLDPATGLILASAAAEALADQREDTVRHVGEEVESDLTRALQAALSDVHHVSGLRRDPVVDDLLGDLTAACERVQLARRFHNDAVAQAQRVRRKRVVRWARLAGRADLPRMVELDDSSPSALV